MATRLAQRLIKEARSGDVQAQANLGRLYLKGGEGLGASCTAALHWLLTAARVGCEDADALIAECIALERAGGQILEYSEACQRAAARGQAAGYCALGNIYTAGGDGNADLGKAEAAYRVAARLGHVTAARKLGLLLAKGANAEAAGPSDEAAHWLQSAAAAGDQTAAQSLGKLLWRSGDRAAAHWLEPQARRGDLEAMYRLGDLLCQQQDGEPARRGAYWLERAARKGHPLALWRYGRMHIKQFNETPTGLPHSPLQAARLLERAALAGESRALWDLARIYEMPRFSRRNLGKARDYLEQAAAAGIGEAELELGKRLSRYKNDRDAWIAAGRWLSSAAEKGSGEAQALLERIADRAPAWPKGSVRRQDEVLNRMRALHPIAAARLELAARFGLTPRETLFVDPLEIDRTWGIEVDLSRHFTRSPWRLVVIESADQRLALQRARAAFHSAENPDLDLSGSSTLGRTRQFIGICSRLAVDPSLFVRNWKAPLQTCEATPDRANLEAVAG